MLREARKWKWAFFFVDIITSIRGNAPRTGGAPDAGSPPRTAATPHGPQCRLLVLKEDEDKQIRAIKLHSPGLTLRRSRLLPAAAVAVALASPLPTVKISYT